MTDFTFIHAADLHLDSPFQGIKEVSEEVARELREATFMSLERIIALCLREKVDFLVLAGDLFDHSNYSLRAWLRLRDQLARLSEQKIATFVAWGNHDHAAGSRVDISWPDMVYFFPPGEVAEFPILSGRREIARVHGISYPKAHVAENYASKFVRKSSLFHLGVLHCNVGEQPGHGNYAPCRLEDLINRGFDYWALGHVHTRVILHRELPTIVYPGNSQGRNPRETGEKGCYLVRVKSGRVAALEFRPVDSIRWLVEDVNILEISNEQELLNKLYDHLELLQRGMCGIPVLVRVYLSGRSRLHRRLCDGTYLEDLLMELREWLADKRPFIWLESIKVRTKPEIQVEELLTQDNLPGDFLRLAQEAQDNRELFFILKESLSPLFNHRRLRQFLPSFTDEQLEDWLDEAVWLGLELLTKEEE
ncbi:metallophosphoesterase family protein [Desulfolucanica intricata]|uniref:metallophosphoesterase family protein n=1 Tax=Desulfolucanica intricata TaxID=1285191 RepID=UPI00083673F9|nr:DNA repair exonuclease [Desulfolucanica intricata]